MNRTILRLCLLAGIVLLPCRAFAQVTERERPREWNHLAEGARFMDRFLPMRGNVLTSDTWGAGYTRPRYVDNGIEDRIWSYWGGNIKKGEDGLYHLLVCGWLESSEKGHMEWSNSCVFNTVSDNLSGPFRLRNMIGKGHNPEVYQLNDGRYVLYVIGGIYISDDLNGKWQRAELGLNPRDRRIIEGLSNLSFARREDGSFLMVCRGGGIWISKDGLSEYNQITDKSVYPDVNGCFEDPVIWRDHIQYHMIVNDWMGRIAWYLRSADGIHWVVDPGEAYMPGIASHEDGTKEKWFKYERMKVFQDEYGRAVQANFAVIDTIKWDDKPYDNHSSKNIAIPLNPGLLLSIEDQKPITARTKEIRLRVKAEDGFDPQTDIDLPSLRFGASAEVNFGRGCSVLRTEKSGKDLIVVFDGKGNGITKEEFAPKLIGKYKDGRVLYGYARLPYMDYLNPILSARAPSFEQKNGKQECAIEVQNFGQTGSPSALVKIENTKGGKNAVIASGEVPPLQPYAKTTLHLACSRWQTTQGDEPDLTVTIYLNGKEHSTLQLKQK